MRTTKIGLFGIGLDTYWDQFDGLLENLKGYQEKIKQKMEDDGVEVIDAGLVDNPEKARDAASMLPLGQRAPHCQAVPVLPGAGG